MLWPGPAQRDRLVEIRDNLHARIAEAEREGRLGEVEGLRVSLAGAGDKLAQINRRPRNGAAVGLGLPTPPRSTGGSAMTSTCTAPRNPGSTGPICPAKSAATPRTSRIGTARRLVAARSACASCDHRNGNTEMPCETAIAP